MKRKRNTRNYKKSKTATKLQVDGFEIVSLPFPAPKSKLLEEIIKLGNNGNNIFNNKRGGGDNKRSQTFISKCTVSKQLMMFIYSIKDIVKNIYPDLIPTDMVILRSLAGCKKQIPHCDYEQDLSFGITPDNKIPLGCVISIMPGTTLDIWPRSIRLPCLDKELTDKTEPILRQTISLDPGKMLFFRGDLVHAGSSYDKDNYRLHLFIDSDDVKRNPNRTWFMNKMGYIK